MRQSIRRFLTDTRANVAIIFALTLPIVIGGAGFGVETSYWYFKRLEMQAAADAAAHASALEKRSGSDDATVIQVATAVASQNGFASPTSTITVHTPPVSGPSAGLDAVEVIIASPTARFFTAIFNTADVSISTRAVARYTTASSACILALHPTASRAAQFSGASSTTLNGCSVMANSTAGDAVNLQGSAVLSVDCLISAGGVSATASLTMTECASALINAPQVADPFADLVPPPVTGACQPDSGSTRSPGRYCNGMDLKNTVTLSPGTYIVENSDFKVNANAVVSGTDVFIYLTGGADIDMNGNSQTNLKAYETGDYAGVLFWGASSSGTNKINGNNLSSLTGAIYAPNQAVEYNGNFSGIDGCTQVVAKTVNWTGSSTVEADCTHLGLRDIPAYSLVQLTE